jgi:hypothetical protein
VKRKPQDILDELEISLAGLKQTTLSGPDFKSIDNLCEQWLILRGYSVKSPQAYSTAPKTLDDLVNIFYFCFKEHYPDFIAPYNNRKHDLKMAKDFVNSRMEIEGINREKALAQCAHIIEALFRYKERFDFDPVPTFGIFSPSMSWLVDKLIKLMNKNKMKILRERIEYKVEQQTRLIEKDNVVNELNDILRRGNV